MSYYRTSSIVGFPRWTPVVRALIIVCSVTFLLQQIDWIAGNPMFVSKFGLVPADVVRNFFIWQPVTYIFLHGGPFHLLINMLVLWMFGSDLEREWGPRPFLKFFFVCGVGAGLLIVLLSPFSSTATIGASGSIYGILLAFAMLWPNRIIYFIIFPIPAKWFVLAIGGLAFFSALAASGDGVSHIAHLGGMLFGFIYMRGWRMIGGLRGRYDRWQRQRLRRKFEVYYNDRRRDDDDDDNGRWRRWK